MSERLGATSEDWRHFSKVLGLTECLLPTVCNKSAKPSPYTVLTDPGKVPSEYNDDRQFRGFKQWAEHVATDDQVARWSAEPDYGICVVTRGVVGIDVDIDAAAAAEPIIRLVEGILGPLPKRGRQGSARVLMPVRLAGFGGKKRILLPWGAVEFLADGNQFVAAGTHVKSGRRYEWVGGLPAHIPEVRAEAMQALLDYLGRMGSVQTDSKSSVVRGERVQADDPVADFLHDNNLVLREMSDGKLVVECPWSADHSSDTTGSDTTIYYPAGVGGVLSRGFKCLHAHCADRTARDFRNAIGYEEPAANVDEVFEEVEHVDQETGEITRKMVPVSEGLFAAIAACMTPDDLRGSMVRRVAAARLGPLLDSQLCKAIADRLKAIGDVATTVSAVRAEVLASRRAARREEDDGEGVDYTSPLPVTTDKGVPKACWENLREILRRLGVVARYNVMTKREEVLIPGRGFSQDNRDNAALALVKSECSKFNMPVGDITGLLTLLADENPHNPMAAWIDSKPWDGVDRVKAICGTVITEPAHTRLKDVMIRRWLTAAVACAFEPDGVAVQGVLVFQGAQGIGKSTWLTNLAPSGMTADGVILRTDNPDSKREALGRWLVELAELDATFKKSDIESLKAFITKKCDEIRAPYAAKASMWARRTVFFASVNPKHFLHDTTGNRRFWVVPVTNLARDHGIDMQQMWAQIKVEWANGARFTLSEDELAGLSKSNAAHSSESPIQVLLEDSFDWHAPHDQWLWKTRKQIMADCGVRNEPSTRVLADLARVLDGRGCERKTVRGVPMQRIPPILRLGENFE
jgi:Virulence-associated protein E/Bifunctional DNA primase/polymerase, N-terminal